LIVGGEQVLALFIKAETSRLFSPETTEQTKPCEDFSIFARFIVPRRSSYVTHCGVAVGLIGVGGGLTGLGVNVGTTASSDEINWRVGTSK
jgi:hypothetical protein